jgi:nicotinate-nucleotide pyrophosphorylase (carboxylating)
VGTPPPTEDIRRLVAAALAEDVGTGDVTAQLIAPTSASKATIVTRESGVFCGRPWADEVLRQVDASVTADWLVADGEPISAGQRLVTLAGPSRSLLTAERNVLNFLQLLSGTATHAARYVEAVAGTNATILDTRKTIPGLRSAQKYAVVCGGASNHRMGLFDAFLIKENHIAAAGSIEAAIERARAAAPDKPVEIEVETEAELDQALAAGADTIMLDNFDVARLAVAVATTAGRAKLEASGGITLDTIRAVAETGVDFISVGEITKDVRPLDLSMRFEELAER